MNKPLLVKLSSLCVLLCAGCMMVTDKPTEEKQNEPMLRVDRLATNLGMTIDTMNAAQISMRRGTDHVVLLSGKAQAFLNGRKVADRVRVTQRNDGYYVHPTLETVIRKSLAGLRHSGRRVVIDAGHGGKDTGAISVHRVSEKDIVLPAAKEVARLLRAKGVTVIMTRDTDRFIELRRRAEIANENRADLFVSIHADWAKNKLARGFTMYIGQERRHGISAPSRAAAEHLEKAFKKSSSLSSRGIRTARFQVLTRTRCPAVLVELGYLSNKTEATLLQNGTFLQKLAGCVATGVENYLTASAR